MACIVLVVDDSSTVRSQASRALNEAGFEVLEAVDGVDALEKLDARADIGLVVCDMNMPRMNGVELVEALAKRPDRRMPPVIMLTTEGHPQLIKRAKASGAKGWMMKPFKAELLAAAARKVIAAAAA
jgi:two-component system chemotaxis response regulator CheY